MNSLIKGSHIFTVLSVIKHVLPKIYKNLQKPCLSLSLTDLLKLRNLYKKVNYCCVKLKSTVLMKQSTNISGLQERAI